MAIAFGNTTSTASVATGATTSFSTSGSSVALLVHVWFTTGSGQAITSVTYGGQSLSLVETVTTTAPTTNALYALTFAPTGANNIVVNFTGGGTMTMQAAYWTNVHATGAKATNTSAGNISVSVTTTADNSWLVAGLFGNHATAGAGTTYRNTGSDTGFCDSGAAITPAGSYTLNMNNTAGGIGILAVELQPTINYPLSITQASYVLTFISSTPSHGKTLAATVATYAITAFTTTFGNLLWNRQAKNTSTWTNEPRS